MLRWSLAGLTAVAALFLCGCERGYSSSSRTDAATEPAVAPRRVKTIQAKVSPLERTVNAFGSLAALDRATLSTKVSGRLESIPVDLGSEVRQGELIAQIEPRDYQLQVQQAEALLAQARARLGLSLDGTNDITDIETTSTVRQTRAVLEEARANRDRVIKLTGQGISSTSELETSEATYKVAISRYEDALSEVRNRQSLAKQRRAELDIARQQLIDTAIVAPIDGVVQMRTANLGEFVSSGMPLVTIVRMNPLRLRLEVPEREASLIRIGQPVRLRLAGNTNVYTGEIKRLSPAIEGNTLMLHVEANVANPGELRPGSFAKAEIVTDSQASAILLPSPALVTFAGIEKVLVVESGNVVEKIVSTGRRHPTLVEVVSGIKAGDVVITEPGGLQIGQAVSVDTN